MSGTRHWAAIGVVISGCTHCTEGPVDSKPDSGPPDAASDRVVKDVAQSDAIAIDAASVSDFPGWRRLTELDAMCGVDVPIDPAKVLPSINWIPCTDGRPKCLQIDTTSWKAGTAQNYFTIGRMSEDQSYLILLGRALDDPQNYQAGSELDVIDTKTWKAVAAFRSSGDPNLANCDLNVAISKSSAIFAATRVTNGGPLLLDQRPVSAIGQLTFSFQPTDISPWSSYKSLPQQFFASDSVMAFDLQPLHDVTRIQANSTHATLSSGAVLTFPLINGNDVLAVDQQGNGGWARIMRVNADGSTTVFRSVANHTVATPASDGATIYWTECYGTSNPASPTQPNNELWAAPYTNDPTTLAATAQKVATLGSDCVFDLTQIAQNGLFAAKSGTLNYVYRRADGKVMSFSNGASRITAYPLAISNTEYLSIEGTVNGQSGVALTRIQLDPW